jgi:phenylpropionate dioxygenase-like ring-hydroxylating dioxygenase large terminal subunit
MADPCLRHWHPLLQSRSLGQQPVRRRLAGQELVLFRTGTGVAAALEAVCPHRRMDLGVGAVRGEQLVCRYHGWRFGADGAVGCPLMPGAGLQHRAYQVREAHGLIWLRLADGEEPSNQDGPSLPTWPHSDLELAGITLHQVAAPLELTLDNFTETEHTTTVHQVFGFTDPAAIELRVELEPSATRVWNSGPQKGFPRLFDAFIDIRPGDRFANDWVTRFAPVHTIYEQTWRRREGGLRRFRLRVVMFFLPVDGQHTQLTTLIYSPRVLWGPLHQWLAAPIIRAITAHELNLDAKALSQLADPCVELNPRSLGPFDRVLLENRRRIERLYRGE